MVFQHFPPQSGEKASIAAVRKGLKLFLLFRGEIYYFKSFSEIFAAKRQLLKKSVNYRKSSFQQFSGGGSAGHWLTTYQQYFPMFFGMLLFFLAESIFPKLQKAVALRRLIGFGSSDTLRLCSSRELLISEVSCTKF